MLNLTSSGIEMENEVFTLCQLLSHNKKQNFCCKSDYKQPKLIFIYNLSFLWGQSAEISESQLSVSTLTHVSTCQGYTYICVANYLLEFNKYHEYGEISCWLSTKNTLIQTYTYSSMGVYVTF
jgi:hypothetical protein